MVCTGSGMKTSFSLSRFHGSRKYYKSYQGKEQLNSPTQLQHLMNQDNCWHGKICIKVQQLQFTCWWQPTAVYLDVRPTNRMKIMPSIQNTASSPGAGKDIVLRKESSTILLEQHNSLLHSKFYI